MKFITKLLWVALLTTTLFAQSRNVPVVLISIDGLKPDYITEADKHHLKIPNLRKMLAQGSYAKAVTGILPTVTYPSHTTMLTGVSPSKHGILYNTPFDPFGKNLGGWMWYAEDIKSLTLWEATNKAGFVTSSVDWPVSVGAPIKYNIVQIWRATTEDDHKLLRALSTPGLLDEGEKVLGKYPAGYIYTVESDTTRAAFSAWIIENKKPRFHTTYFSVLDEVQHATGPYTKEAYETIEMLDGLIGKVWQAALKANKNAVVCVVSDHGFARYDKAVHINSALHDAGLIELDAQGKLKSWRTIVWGSGAHHVHGDAASFQFALRLDRTGVNGLPMLVRGAFGNDGDGVGVRRAQQRSASQREREQGRGFHAGQGRNDVIVVQCFCHAGGGCRIATKS